MSNNTPAAKANWRDWRGPLWDAVDAYVRACRGDPSKWVYGNTPRQLAVHEAERAVKSALIAAKLEVLDELPAYLLECSRRTVGSTIGPGCAHVAAGLIAEYADQLSRQLSATDSGTEGTL